MPEPRAVHPTCHALSSSSMAMRPIVLAAIVALAGMAIDLPVDAADKPQADRRAVELRFLGDDKQVPLADIEVLVTNGYGDQQKKFGPYTTDKSGTVSVSLPPGSYSLHLTSKKDLPYLPVEVLWNKESRGPQPDLSLSVKATGVEKWLRGDRQDAGYEAPAKPTDAPRITYTLLPACELVLRAVDADSGKGIAGAKFYTENAVGEEWAHSIENQNVGGKSIPDDSKENATDSEGYLRRLVSANANFLYGVEIVPPGYELVEPRGEVEIEVVYGKRHAEQVFKFRRKP